VQQRQPRPRLLQALIDAFSLPDLRRRILFTLGILIIFRFCAHIPLPGVNPETLENIFETNALMGMLDMFSGGAMRTFSIVAMGVYPYITATIIMQLLVPVVPRLQAIAREGEAGRNKINLYTHWLMLPLAGLQGYGQYVLLTRQGGLTPEDTLTVATIVISLIAGTMFMVWLGELITERGIGNGISMIIFAGILAGFPEMIGQGLIAKEEMAGLIGFIILALAIVFLIVLFAEGHRRIPVHYSKSVFRGRRQYKQTGSTHIPLRVNTAGMIPLIFAMSLVILPTTVASYFQGGVAEFFQDWASKWSYWLVYFVLTVAFTFFYTMVIFEQMDLANTLQKQGGFVPGVRPGPATTSYLGGVMTRLTWGGALFLGFIAVSPFVVENITNIQVVALSGTALLIVVGVALDTMKQLESQLLMRRYEGFLR